MARDGVRNSRAEAVLRPKAWYKPPVGIGDHRTKDLELLDKGRRLLRTAHADQGQTAAGLFESVEVVAQLRHLLATECSAQMPQKHQNQRLIVP